MIASGVASGTHVFSVDVEEYFQVHAFESRIARDEWESMPSRVERGVDALLGLLDRHDARATFFVLGWIGRRHPDLVRRIAAEGHEIASHGWSHRRVSELRREAFREEVRDSRALLGDLAGRAVIGYRAPSFSLLPGCEWAFDVLLEEGYRYDSSLFPIRRANYGYPGALPEPHLIAREAGVILELPMTLATWRGIRIPASGGGYFRQLPYRISRHAFRQRAENGTPAVFYVHPWELDPDQPRVRAPWLTRRRHYGGLATVGERLERLLSEFRFTSVDRCFKVRDGTPPENGGPDS
ncbi:MAG: XrtA system polysaccharide deacetylase [Gemmatimonadota bacterium]